MSLKAVKSIVVATIKLSERSEEVKHKLSFKLMCQIVHGNLGFGRSISVLADAAPSQSACARCIIVGGVSACILWEVKGKKEGGEREGGVHIRSHKSPLATFMPCFCFNLTIGVVPFDLTCNLLQVS